MRLNQMLRYVYGKQTIVNKVAFYINEEYMFDHYENIMKHLNPNCFDVVLHDKFNSENYNYLIERLKSYAWNVKFLADILYIYKYKVFVSHLYLGGGTTALGSVFSRLVVIFYKFCHKLFQKPYINNNQQYLQKVIGELNIKFMYGADNGVNSFYEYGNNYNELYDIFLCHGPRDAEITKSLFDKPIDIMGYPRYDKFFEKVDDKVYKNKLCEKYLIDNSKKTILWITTVNKYFSTIETYSERMKNLLGSYNVIVRPHPLEIDPQYSRFNQNVLDIVSNENFFFSDDRYQEMTELYLISNFVFCDYGGSIFSALYMDKRIILLNHKEVEKDLVVSTSTSIEAREYFPSINQDDDNFFSYLDMDWTQWDKAREKARKHYFGKINTDASKRVALYLNNIVRY
jgi:hypothetical protein